MDLDEPDATRATFTGARRGGRRPVSEVASADVLEIR